MKYCIYLISIIAISSCSNPSPGTGESAFDQPKIDIASEIKAINTMRDEFITAIDEKRYSDLGKYTHPDLIAIGPGSAEWAEYRKQREEQTGLFSYDSIRMFPYETMILNDSMAYDFGWSAVYYTDPDGNPVELNDTFFVMFKKGVDGQWKLWREVSSARVDDFSK